LLLGTSASSWLDEVHQVVVAFALTCVCMVTSPRRGRLVTRTARRRGGRHDGLHAAQQLHLHDLAGHIVRQQRRRRRGRRLRARARRQRVVPRPDGLVRPALGAHRLRRRGNRRVPRLRHGRLRRGRELHPRRGAPRHARRVHPRGRRREGLLRREPGRRGRARRAGQLRADQVLEAVQGGVPR
uniref:Uncharacterized protein n=1 Tax=Aegilops tauschii subsp. strangulata TaxID=200361 RepID=A0A453IL57_AEGTS